MGEDGDGGRAAANQQYTGGTGLVRGPNPAALRIKLPTVMNCSTRNEHIVYAAVFLDSYIRQKYINLFSGSTLFQTLHHRRPSFSGCRLTDLELTTRLRSFQHQLKTLLFQRSFIY